QELLRLLRHHRGVQTDLVMSARAGVTPAAPALPVDPVIEPLDLEQLEFADVVFLCTPHGAAAPLAQEALARGAKVVDLSADFRLKDPAVYATTYGQEH